MSFFRRMTKEDSEKQSPPLLSSSTIYIEDGERGPTFTSKAWRRSRPDTHPPVFAYDKYDEPHRKRRLAILQKYPQIRKLFGYDHRTVWFLFSILAVQLPMCWFLSQIKPLLSPRLFWAIFVVVAYVVGGTATSVAGVVIHEVGHGLAVQSPLFNRLFCCLVNAVIPVPMAMSFRRYHFEHHIHQGTDGLDPDLPLKWELSLIRGSFWKKILWISIYPFMYVIRGAAMKKSPTKWELINWAFTLTTDFIVYWYSGWLGLGYLGLSLWLGYTFHPGAMHFIQEHYTYVDGQETYSYYGSLNPYYLNIGYHNEHHDFPQVLQKNLNDRILFFLISVDSVDETPAGQIHRPRVL